MYDDRSQPVDDPDRHPNGTPVANTTHDFLETATVTFTAEENGTYCVQIVEGIENFDLLGRSTRGEIVGPRPYEITVSRTEQAPPDDPC